MLKKMCSTEAELCKSILIFWLHMVSLNVLIIIYLLLQVWDTDNDFYDFELVS